mmetsp:Transcript_86815/g.225493  ORF Transcript_86815/g.225493 Transcript_86815/m.225493 type:complete len:155 (-) Transcript_86815:43-507(-)
MGNCESAMVHDSYGVPLQEGCWVECTNKKGEGQTRQGTGKVKFIYNDQITFYWPSWGTYNYTQNDIYWYGLRRIMSDKAGTKLQKDQLVQCMKDGYQEGIVISVDTESVGVSWVGEKGCGNGRKLLSQNEVEQFGLKIIGSNARDRKCVAGPCM